MITANSNTQLKSALQFKPESGELAGHTYNITMLVCSNPACDCGFSKINFHKEDAPGIEHPVAVLEANVFEGSLNLPETHPSLSP